ncbi:DUF397 domain-containing protein [Actinomadura welshii]
MIEWRKSSRSNASGNECVEVADLPEGRAIRDSQAPDAGHLTLSVESFARLISRMKRNELNL